MTTDIIIDGSQGEGGGQMLRSALAMSMCTGQSVTIHHIRAKRRRPGLLRQHLTAVKAAVAITDAVVSDLTLGASEIVFKPGKVKSGKYHFSVGSAGSSVLVFQTILPALLMASERSEITLEGGTHNPWAPTFDFLHHCFFPLLKRMGVQIEASIDRFGFYPAGGGQWRVRIDPITHFQPLVLIERGEVKVKQAIALVADISESIGHREIEFVQKKLGWLAHELAVKKISNSCGPGNVLSLLLESEFNTELFCGFGEKGIKAESVARKTVSQVRRYLKSEVPVGEYLADQLLIPLALAGSGCFKTMRPSLHTLTNKMVIELFLPVKFDIYEIGEDQWYIELK